MRNILLPAALLAVQTLCAQKVIIKGQLTDTAGAPLHSATVLLLNPKDSSLVSFGSTGKEGFFELKNQNPAEYLLKATYISREPLFRLISPAAKESVVDLGTLTMEPADMLLKEISVKGMRDPVTIKKDTIEFNAGSFKTQPNAVVEDLLKKLPGLEVDNDGTIRAQGEQVQRVTVDGREFFGRDPKLATRNLPADAIDKVQVYDRTSDQAQFTGIDDGQREKTINLELKEEKRNGMFGNAIAGYGTDNRFTGKLSLNRFGKDRQLSLIGTANNVNEQGFSIDDYMTFNGGGNAFPAGGAGGIRTITVTAGGGGGSSGMQPGNGQTNGLMNTYGGGVNFNQDLSSKTRLSANYFVNYLDHNILQDTERENFNLPANKYYSQNSRLASTNLNHRLNFILDHQIDSSNSFKWTNGLTLSNTRSDQDSYTQNLSADSLLQSSSDAATSAKGSTVSYNTELLYRHRFAKKGRTFSASLTGSISNTDRNETIDSRNTYLSLPDPVQVMQDNSQSTLNYSYGANLSYTEPLGDRRYLELNYNIRQNKNDVDRDVFDIEEEWREYSDSLSSLYNSAYLYQRAGFNFRLNRDRYSVTLGTGYQYTRLDGEGTVFNYETAQTEPFSIPRTFSSLLPVLRFNYDFSNNMRFRLDYETSLQEPSIQQLQPIVDNSNQIAVSVGNENLQPAYRHSARINFTRFDPVSFISFFSFISATYTRNAITTSQSFDTETLVTTSRPVNTDDNRNISFNGTVSFPLNKLYSRFNLSASVAGQQSINVTEETAGGRLVSTTKTDINQLTLGGNLRYTFTYKEVFDLSLSSQLSHQRTDYQAADRTDQTYFNKTYSSEANVNFLKKYRLSGLFSYREYDSQTNNSTVAIPMLNFSLSRYVMKANAGEIKLSVNNVLDRNLGVSQSANTSYFERQTMNSLGRYFLFSFTYAINRHLNPMGGGRRNGPVRMMIGG